MEAPKNEIEFAHEFLGGNGRARITIRAGEQEFTDELKVTTAEARERFAAKACERFGALDEETVHAELDRVVREYAPYCERLKTEEREQEERDEAAREQQERSDVDTLVSIAEDLKHALLFRTPEHHDPLAFAVLIVGKTRQTCPVNSKPMRQWLLKQFRLRQKRLPSRHALDEAIFAIEAITLQGDVVDEVHLRIAKHKGAIYIDLGDGTWRAIRVKPAGWEIVPSDDVPVHFLRRRGMKALPVPERGGSLHELFEYVNLPEGGQRCLFLCYLVAALCPWGPYTILVVNGEQGSAKSTLCRRARDLVDPSEVALRAFPRDARDLMIAAKNGWLQAYDNISSISPWMSDALCSLSTGAGFGTRQLYKDDEETLFWEIRPSMLNGIPDLATRPDLLDRSIVLVLPPIPEKLRADEATLGASFKAAYPRILGALLDVLASTLARHPHVRLSGAPRMADFARIGLAAAPALGYSEEYFLAAYRANREDQVSIAIESSPIAAAVMKVMAARSRWEVSAEDLLSELDRARSESSADRPPRGWPHQASVLANELLRLAPLFRQKGLEVKTGLRRSGGNRDRYLLLQWIDDDPEPNADARPDATPATGQPSAAAPPRGPRCANCGGRNLWHRRSDRPQDFRCADCTTLSAEDDPVWIYQRAPVDEAQGRDTRGAVTDSTGLRADSSTPSTPGAPGSQGARQSSASSAPPEQNPPPTNQERLFPREGWDDV